MYIPKSILLIFLGVVISIIAALTISGQFSHFYNKTPLVENANKEEIVYPSSGPTSSPSTSLQPTASQITSSPSIPSQPDKEKSAPLSSPLKMTNDFQACLGIDQTQKNPIAYHRILLASSKDGLHFTRLNKLISDRASVPDIMIDKEGNVRIYFVLITCKEQGQDLNNIPVVAISSDNGKSWVYKKLIIEAPSDASYCKAPNGSPAPVDPEVLLMPDGTYRLYATCPQYRAQGTPMTYVFFSNDGIHFSGPKHTYIPQSGIALDPVVIKFGNTWHLFNGNSNPATSLDGITFNQPKTGIFCPFKFKDGNIDKCYVIGDVLTLENPLRYRIYLFGDTPNEGFKSILSADGKNWTMEQNSGEYILTITPGAKEEYHKLMFPTVAKLKDGTFLMAYETFIPGTPSSVIESAAGGNQSEKTTPQGQEQKPSFQPPSNFQSVPNLPPSPGSQPPSNFSPQQPIGKCGDGICDSIEKMTNTCPLDCH